MKFVINGVTFDQNPKWCTDPEPDICSESYEAFVRQSYSVIMLADNGGGSAFNGWRINSLVASWGNGQDVTPIVLPTSVNVGDMNYANWRISGNGAGTGGNTGEFEGVITSITLASNPPLNCVGYDTPFDNALFIKNKAKMVIPIKIALYDEDGFLITDQDVTAPPVINVKYSSASQGDGVENIEIKEFTGKSSEGNAFTFNPDTDQWEYQLGTKQFSEPGTYTVSVISGDGLEYTIDDECIQTFERLQKRR